MTGPLDTAAKALRITDPRYPWIQPTEEEAEVGDLLAELAALHVQSGTRCTGCAETWPCKGWLHGYELAVQWVGRASARVLSRTAKATGSGLSATCRNGEAA